MLFLRKYRSRFTAKGRSPANHVTSRRLLHRELSLELLEARTLLDGSGSHTQVVTQVYRDFLGREPESTGLAFWAATLDQGTLNARSMVLAIESSPEFHSHEIQNLFNGLLHRPAEPAGLQNWQNYMAAGGNYAGLQTAVLASSEYFAAHGGTNADFLQAIYQDKLGRPIDDNAANAWGALLAGGSSRSAIVASILSSTEAVTAEIRGLYSDLLRRSADGAGLAHFVSQQLDGKLIHEFVMAALAASDEYSSLATMLGPISPLTDPTAIKALATEAFVWGSSVEYMQRFSTYNNFVTAPLNTMGYGGTAAAWNNQAVNAGDPAVLYNTAFLDFSKTDALVLTVPPSNEEYYVVSYMDAYANAIGSIGTRTTASDVATSYLFVGPNSPYAADKTATINGFQYQVMASDTNLNWMLIRIAADTLTDSGPNSTASVYANYVQKFFLNTLTDFENNGNQPVLPTSYLFTPTQQDMIAAEPYASTPTDAVAFFSQVGTSLMNNPVPSNTGGLSGTSLPDLPAYVIPQVGATDVYISPSFGQQGILDSFALLGLTANGFHIPSNWKQTQLDALQAGFVDGQSYVQTVANTPSSTLAEKNYWSFLNTIVGTYPSNEVGYLLRSVIVYEGGVANIALDAVYPSTTQIATATGSVPLDGNNTYSITFTPPASPPSSTFPVVGIYPPQVSDTNGNPIGFWSVTLYQPDSAGAGAPFLSQAGVLNTYYSPVNSTVLSVDAATGMMTVPAPLSGKIKASTPILFGSDAAVYGLEPNTVYYVASTPETDNPTNPTTYSFQISKQWIQTVSSTGVPIQNTGNPGAIVPLLQAPAGAAALTYGLVNSVSQLGSAQLTDGELQKNADGSLTLWFAPSLPTGAAASNWIPTPSTSFFESIYANGSTMNTNLQIDLRMYYPTPGNEPPSILPYSTEVDYTYIPPALVLEVSA
ncbi:hypothetical protein BH10PLA2_BH10PLA2_14180 [soil metagenome]